MSVVCVTLSVFVMQTQFCRRNNAFSSYGSLVCDLVNCDLPEVPRCEDGQIVVLKNPGECQPIHECGMTFRHSLMFELSLSLSLSLTHTTHPCELVYISLSACLPRQYAKRRSVSVKLPPTAPHIASCQRSRQRAVMCLSVCAIVRTPLAPARLVSSHPPQPMTVAAQKPTVCQTR